MKIVVYPHDLGIGGSQRNAIELAGAVRDRGHDVILFGRPGELCGLIDNLGLPFVASPPPGPRPSPKVMAQLCRIVREEVVDVVHGYEWPPALEAAYGPGLRFGTATFATVMSMAVAPFLPPRMPLVVGTELIRDNTRRTRPGPVDLIEPPVDTRVNAPDAVDADEMAKLRATAGLRAGDLHVVAVSRLAVELKLEGLLTAIDVVGKLARELPVRLVVVGDGPARATVEERAAAANAGLDRPAVVLTGALLDPRPAYALADVMLGMGGSALHAMAFAKPLIVQGEHAFWELLTPDTVGTFLRHGWYGIGDGEGGAARLEAALRPLLADPALRATLAQYGRELVVERFSLAKAAATQEELYRRALRDATSRHLADVGRGVAGLARYKVERRYQRLRGTASTDDFNARSLMKGLTR